MPLMRVDEEANAPMLIKVQITDGLLPTETVHAVVHLLLIAKHLFLRDFTYGADGLSVNSYVPEGADLEQVKSEIIEYCAPILCAVPKVKDSPWICEVK